MIMRKEDYRFVTEDALKNIAVRGNIFPIRGQKLVLLGEDEAFLREAILERRFYEAGPGGQQITPYDSRIIESRPKLFSTIGELFSSIHGLITGARWYDADKLEEESEPITVYDVSGEEPPDSSERMANVNDQLYESLVQINKVRRAASDGIGNAREALEDAKKVAFRTRESERKRIEGAYYDAVNAANETYSGGMASEDERHTGRMKAIEDAYRQAIKSGDPDASKKYIRDKHEELDLNDTKKTTLLHNLRTATAEADNMRSEGIRAAENAYEEAVKDAEKTARETIAEIVENRDETIAGIEESSRMAAYASIGAIPFPDGMNPDGGDPSPDYPVYNFHIGYAPEYHAFMKRTAACSIVKSCLDRYDAQYGRSYPSGTATNRMFADLERLVTLNIGSVSLYRKATHERLIYTYFTYGDGELIVHNEDHRSPLGGEWEGPTGSSYGGMQLDYNYDNATDTSYGVGHHRMKQYSQEDREFRVYYGRRHEIDQVEYILVDILFRRYDKKITTYPGEEEGDDDQDTKLVAHKYFIKRVKFTKSGICAEGLLNRLDALDDAYADAVKEEDDKYAEKIAEIEKDYNSSIDGLDRRLQERYDGFDEEELKKNQRSKDTFVQTAGGGLTDVNTRIHDAKDASERSRIRSEYISGTVIPARLKMESEIWQHANEKERKRREAEAETDEQKHDAWRKMLGKKAAAKKVRDEAVSELSEAYQKNRLDIKRIPSDEADDVRSQYRRDVSSAEDTHSAAYASALRTANAALDGLVGPDHHSDLDIDPHYWDSMSDEDKDKYRDIQNAYSEKIIEADETLRAEREQAEEACFDALSRIEHLRENARGRFTATLFPIGDDTYGPSDPPSDGSDSWDSKCDVCGVIGAFAVLTPRTLTGVDFSDYYEELEEEEEEQEEET